MAPRLKDNGLNAKQAAFCVEYLKDLNGTKAAIRAGYSPDTAGPQASELLIHPKVAARLAEMDARRLSRADVTAERVLREYIRLATSDPRALFDANGNLLPPHQWTDDAAACVASLEVIVKNAQAGDGHQDVIHKIRIWDKTRALEPLAKHLGLLKDLIEHSGELTVKWPD